MLQLTNYVTLYIPSTLEGSKPAPEKLIEAQVEKIARALTEAFGGATVQNAEGYYLSVSGELIAERVKTIKAYTDASLEIVATVAHELAQTIKRDMMQESVAFETNAGLTLV